VRALEAQYLLLPVAVPDNCCLDSRPPPWQTRSLNLCVNSHWPERKKTRLKSINLLLFLALPAPLLAQYAGPAILSRGEAPAALAAPQIDFQPFVEVSAVYDTGLAGVALNEQGQLATSSSAGATLAWGITGTHSWRHTKVGLAYHGALSFYAEQSRFSNLDQSLLFGVTHQITRHLMFSLNETAGLVTRNFGQLALQQTVPFDPSTAYVPVTDYFDNRTVYSTTQASLQIQKTARLSFALGGSEFIVDRHSKALYGSRGTSATGDLQYRLSRMTTIGAQYEYLHFSYPGIIGSTDAHGAAATYAVRLNREWEFSGYGGFMRVESKFEQTVPIDPVIAALLGISGAEEITHQIAIVPNVAGRLSRTYRTGVAYLSAGHSVLPGNGLFLTSTATQVVLGYAYTGLRFWSFGASGGYDRGTAVGTIAGDYADKNVSLLMSRVIARHLNFVLSFSVRQYSSPTYVNYNRTIEEGSIGVGYSPGDIPLRVW